MAFNESHRSEVEYGRRQVCQLAAPVILFMVVALLAPALASTQEISPPVDRESPQGRAIAIVGATLIDGNGGEPVADAVVLISGERVVAVGPRAAVTIPPDARIIDASGNYITPGFIDTNVHLSLYGGNTNARYETLVRYQHRQPEIVLENAQLELKYGVTTVRDSYGVLPPLLEVREAIRSGEAIGSRMLVAGNIVGWGGPFSLTFSLIPEANLTLFQERVNDLIGQGAGEELMNLTPAELRVAINDYLDKGVDFVKYGGTAHFAQPALIGFSPGQQRVIVEETHKRGLVAETHATSIEGLRLAVEAGIDLIQHPEILTPRLMPDELARLIVEKGAICSMLVNTITGEAWQMHLEKKEEAEEKAAEEPGARTGHQGVAASRAKTSAERRRERRDSEIDLEFRRRNAIKLIRAGCTVTVGTDNYRRAGPELARAPKPQNQDPGIGSIVAIEGLVELGMSPSQALVAATRNGALACRALEEYGTLVAGKIADLLILTDDPLADIHHIRKLKTVMKAGRIVDTDKLPEQPIFYRSGR
ncbi:MAG: amidohydrolase family protein [Acidobacteriota bacterium]